jgi:transcriptional regulator with XRE-family HTH domain
MANNLKKLREALGWSQEKTATALGTTINNYGKLERGERQLSAKWINRAASAFKVDPGEVVGESPSEIKLIGRVIFLGLDGVTFFVIPRTYEVGIELRHATRHQGHVPEIELAVRLTVAEARRFCHLLTGTADEAEALASKRR